MTVLNETGASTYVLVCEHASNHIPTEYGGLGLPAHELERHIAWDIGAAALAQGLSALLDSPCSCLATRVCLSIAIDR